MRASHCIVRHDSRVRVMFLFLAREQGRQLQHPHSFHTCRPCMAGDVTVQKASDRLLRVVRIQALGAVSSCSRPGNVVRHGSGFYAIFIMKDFHHSGVAATMEVYSHAVSSRSIWCRAASVGDGLCAMRPSSSEHMRVDCTDVHACTHASARYHAHKTAHVGVMTCRAMPARTAAADLAACSCGSSAASIALSPDLKHRTTWALEQNGVSEWLQ